MNRFALTWAEFTKDKVVPLAAAGAVVQLFLKKSSENYFLVCEPQIIIVKDNIKIICCSSSSEMK